MQLANAMRWREGLIHVGPTHCTWRPLGSLHEVWGQAGISATAGHGKGQEGKALWVAQSIIFCVTAGWWSIR